MEITALSIPETDRENVQILSNLLVSAGRDIGHDIEVAMVGGATSKPWPRKDIDLLCTLNDLRGMLHGTELEKANEDPEFQNPDILAHRGAIRVRSSSGVPIEIIGGLG